MKGCPPREQLEQLLEDQLVGSAFRDIAAHVDGCARCQKVLEDLTKELDPAGPATLASQEGPASLPTEFLGRLKDLAPTDTLPSLAHRVRARDHSPESRPTLPEGPASLGLSGVAIPEETWPNLPGYEILGVLGRGGAGVVYRARQLSLNRIVALKTVRFIGQSPAQGLARFRLEAETLARLRHPNIVQVYEVGTQGEEPYFAMEYVPGGTLAARLTGQPQPPAQAAALLETVARAVHAAHNAGIVHRDLKPANILLAPVFGRGSNPGSPAPSALEGDVEWVPKITDFGLAKSMHADTGLTQTGLVMGTPGYMAPEQAQGLAWAGGPACDVYSLGAVLYHLLTGRPPFLGTRAMDILLQVVHNDAPPPRDRLPEVPRDLDTICCKCLQKDPQRRYPSAEALADDLHRYRTGQPIEARPMGFLERTWKWIRRRPAAAAAWLVVPLTLLGSLAAAGYWFTVHRLHERASLVVKSEPVPVAPEVRRCQEFLEQGLARCHQGEIAHGLFLLARSLDFATQAGDPDLERAVRKQLAFWNSRLGTPGPRLDFPRGVGAVAFHPRQPKVVLATGATAQAYEAATGWPAGTRLKPAGSGKPELPRIQALALSPRDGQTAATGHADGTVRLWAAGWGSAPWKPLGKPLANPGRAPVWGVAFSPDGKSVAAAFADGKVRLWDTATRRQRPWQLAHEGRVWAVAFSRDSRLLATGSDDGTARLWDATTGRQRITLAHPGPVRAVAFSPDDKRVLTGCQDGTSQLWEAATGKQAGPALRQTRAIRAVAFNLDGRFALTGSEDGTARLWDLTGHETPGPVIYLDGPVAAVAFSSDGGFFLVAGGNGQSGGSASFWRLDPGRAQGLVPPLSNR